MNKQRITEIIAKPENLNYDSDYPLVRELIDSFPYFSTPYVMLSKMLHDENSIYFDKNLKISAAYIGNREILYKYIHENRKNSKQELIEIAAENQLPVEQTDIEKPEITESAPDMVIIPETAPHQFEAAFEEPIIAKAPPEPEPESANPEKEAIPISKKINHFHDFGNEILQYPITDYFSQYYKKDVEVVDRKEISDEEKPDPLSGKKSFTDWLRILESQKKPVAQQKPLSKPEIKEADHSNVNELINKFIHAEPKIKPQQSRMYKPEDMAKLSVKEDHNIATETLANIYLKQGLKSRAVEIFQQLILKYPEKSDYFAGKIKEIQTEGSF